MLISEAFNAYKRDVIQFRNQSASTEENHQNACSSLLNRYGDVAVDSLTFDKIRDWKLGLDKELSDGTVRLYVIKLRMVLKYLYKRRLISLDPESIPIPKAVKKAPQFLTPAEVAQCIAVTRRIKNKAILSMLYGSMLRVSELCSLDRGQIREKRFTVVGKGGKSKLCFIDARSETLLSLYLESRTDNNKALFLSDKGDRITPGAIQETFKTVRRQTGLDCHPHTLRHSGATDLMQNGAHIYTVMRLLGHSNLQSTQVYLHTTDPILQDEFFKNRTI